ncbi:MAG: ABC transporter permease [Verrucomicrobiota bacterium JB022]|nr:ABC transporter permease [Verrucomicrobiota bacterium JB022]
MPWFLYLALKQLFPTGKRFGSFFFWASTLGVALGVAVLVVVQSVMGGFGQEHRTRMVELAGEVVIDAGGRPFYEPAAHEALDQIDSVQSAVPMANGMVMVMYRNIPVFPQIVGIDVMQADGYGWGNFVKEGSLSDLYDGSVAISRTLSDQIGVDVGDYVEVYSPLMLEGLKRDEVILPLELEVTAIYDVDWYQELVPGLMVTLRTMQDLYQLNDGVHAVQVRLKPGSDEFRVVEQLNETLRPGLHAMTWKQRFASQLWVLDFEKTMMLFINLFIVAVAVFAIAIAQLLNVVRKTREIGILGAMGARARELVIQYCFQGFCIGVIGTAAGVALAITILTFRNPIIDVLTRLTGSYDTLVQFYFFYRLPVHYTVQDFVVIISSALVLSTLAGLVPALRAAKMRPAEALRTEA